MRWLLGLTIVVALGCSRKAEDPPAPPPPPGKTLRVVSLTPSATEVMAALGATSMLVGVDEYSEYPAEVQQLPKVGSFLTPNLEVIIKLDPSLVIVDDIHTSSAGALKDSGVATVECAMHSLPDVKSALGVVGARIGKTAEAQAVAAQIDQAIADAIATRPTKRPRVLAIIDREAGGLGNLVAAGTGSYVDELLALVGGENVLAGAGVRYPKLSMEEVLRAAPDVILDLSFAARGDKGLDPWKVVDVPAAKTGRVIVLAEPFLIAPSPRVGAALGVLAKAIATP
ncbi:ABC transporter substrate-binding protein [soil metagenome]